MTSSIRVSASLRIADEEMWRVSVLSGGSGPQAGARVVTKKNRINKSRNLNGFELSEIQSGCREMNGKSDQAIEWFKMLRSEHQEREEMRQSRVELSVAADGSRVPLH